jgi:AraC-like DNA-binding protein
MEPASNDLRNGRFALHYKKRSESYSMPSAHFHEFYELFYLVSGERDYFIKDRTYRVAKGDLVFVNKYDIHKTSDSGLPPQHERFLLSFREDFATSGGFTEHADLLLPFRQPNRVISLEPAEQSVVEMLLFQMLKEKQGRHAHHLLYTQTLLIQLLIFCERIVHRSCAAPGRTPLQLKMAEIMSYIDKHYEEELTLETISRQFYLSTYYICRAFKQVTGFTFLEYLNTVRIREAQRFLRETDMKVTMVAEQVGFQSNAHFSRLFKRIAGMPPVKYRHLMKTK